MKKKWVPAIAVIGAAATVLWLGGLGWTLFGYFFPTAVPSAEPGVTETAKPKPTGLNLLALGDSLTRGTGDTTGKGYLGVLTERLKAQTNQPVSLQNLGVNGYTSSQLAEALKQEEVQRQVKNADVILITIGGNDLFSKGQTLNDPSPQKIQEITDQYTRNLREIQAKLRSINAEATLLLIGLYDPFGQTNDGAVTSPIVREWNTKSAAVWAKDPKAVFVPTYDLFQIKTDSYLSTDLFHPNTEGYRLIADRVAPLIR